MELSSEEKLEILKKILWYSKRNENGCLICSIGLDHNGASNIRIRGILKPTCRVIMHLLKDFNLNSKLYVLHNDSICFSKNCIELNHLRTGTQSENIAEYFDKVGHGNALGIRKKYCKYGHERTQKNVNFRGNCIICTREQAKALYRKRRKSNA